MSAEEVLRESEASALRGGEVISRVSGKGKSSHKKKRLGAMTAGGFVTAIIVVFLAFLGSGNYIIAAISERLIEETDVQYADAVESKMLVFQQALATGTVPKNTIEKLGQDDVLVGRLVDGEFQESVNGDTLLLNASTNNAQVVTAQNFINEVHSNVKLYDTFNKATYDRAAYYYDDSARAVFRKIGTTRNNYDADADFDEVMDSLMGEGSDIDVNGVTLVRRDDDYFYELLGGDAESDDANAFVNGVREKSAGASETEAALQTAETLNVADTLSKEQRSSLFYLLIMENISKTKAGEGSEAKINEAMNYLYETRESTVVDVETGQVVTVKGSMMEAPSLYSVLAGQGFDTASVANYASDRVVKTVSNNIQSDVSDGILNGTVASTAKKTKGSVGRYVTGETVASAESVAAVVPTIAASLTENSFETIRGVAGGEFLVEGAVNVGKELAKASGGSAGDAAAVQSYAKLSSTVLALDAEVDRMNRSPFDITSRNTFLGSIMYKFAVMSADAGSLLSTFSNVLRVAGSFVTDLVTPGVMADDTTSSYLNNFGDCETLGAKGAVGSASCTMIATFDTSTLYDPFNNADFITFIEENTTLNSNGVRTVNDGSDLARYILYNNERVTPMGFTDGGILSSLTGGSSSIPFVSDILSMIKIWLGAGEDERKIASGEAFVNTSNNEDWNKTYKYAQRYTSLARAADVLRQYDGDVGAYSELKFFEGSENPVLAFINQHQNLATINK